METKKTQVERFNQALANIREEVTEMDRKMARTEVGLSGPNISNYLNGKVRNTDTAAKLLQFFRQRIALREELLNTSNQA